MPVVVIIATWMMYNYRVEHSSFNKGISILICGDSHTESSINDSILLHSINISNSSEHYLYTYSILNHILKHNTQIKTIILGCSFHSFHQNYDSYLFEEEKAQGMYLRYLPLLDAEFITKIAFKNGSGIVKSASTLYDKMFTSIIHHSTSYQDYPFTGRYYKSSKSNLNDTTINTSVKRHYYKENGEEQGFSAYQKYYLNKIVDLCQQQKVRLVIINTPLNKAYYAKIPEKFIKDYYAYISSIHQRIAFLDFHSLEFDNKCYGDGDHLNALGARVFSIKVDSALNVLQLGQ